MQYIFILDGLKFRKMEYIFFVDFFCNKFNLIDMNWNCR